MNVARPTALGSRVRFDTASDVARMRWFAPCRAELPVLSRDSASARKQFARVGAAARAGKLTLLCWCAPKLCHAEVITDAIVHASPGVCVLRQILAQDPHI